MSSPRLEGFLARLLVDADFRGEFLADPGRVIEREQMDDAERQALIDIDRTGLQFAARSIAAKRHGRASRFEAMTGWIAGIRRRL
jgi:hypothetical protein